MRKAMFCLIAHHTVEFSYFYFFSFALYHIDINCNKKILVYVAKIKLIKSNVFFAGSRGNIY